MDYGSFFTLLYWLNALIAVWITVRVVLDNRNPIVTFAWIFVLLFLPYIGLLLYFFFGRDARKREYIKKRFREQIGQKVMFNYASNLKSKMPDSYSSLISYLEKSAKSYPMHGCGVSLMPATSDFVDELLLEIAKAEEHIHMQFYIFEDDELGTRVRDALIERARSGVEVRLLYDSVGCWSVKKSFYDEIRRAGGYVESFLKVRFPLFTNKVNYRNHRKAVIIDGRLAFIGGCNIANRYIEGFNRGVWRDTMIAIRGSGVRAVQAMFLMDWLFANGSMVSGDRYFPVSECSGSDIVQLVVSNPVDLWRYIPDALVRTLYTAKSYVYLQTPYFMPTETLLKAMQHVALSGVDVRLMVPLHSDNTIVELASYSYLGTLLAAGVKVYLFEKGFLHAKTIVSDDALSIVGSANLDFRSFEYNFELSSYVYSDSFAAEMKAQFCRDMQCCRQLTLREYESRGLSLRLRQSIARLFSPIL